MLACDFTERFNTEQNIIYLYICHPQHANAHASFEVHKLPRSKLRLKRYYFNFSKKNCPHSQFSLICPTRGFLVLAYIDGISECTYLNIRRFQLAAKLGRPKCLPIPSGPLVVFNQWQHITPVTNWSKRYGDWKSLLDLMLWIYLV